MSCRLLSRNSLQTNKELSREPVGFFRHICFLGAGKYIPHFFINTGNGIPLSYVYFWSDATLLTGYFFHSRKNHSRWLAFSGRNQAHNLTSIFHMNVLSNILTGVLEGSSARLLQCSPFPTDTGAVFNFFSKQSCLQTNCSLSPYLCPVGCFREILFKQTRNCHWNQLDFSDISASWAQEST